MKKALIFGVTGQDGSYLAELLLEKGYEVHGFIRKSATGNTKNIDHIIDRMQMHRGDLADTTSIYRVINEVKPNEIYNEADQDHVGWSYDSVDYTSDITGAAVGRILEAIRQIDKSIRFFQPISSNIFGQAPNPQTEETPLNPQSPYACAKSYAYVLARYYRRVQGLYASTAIYYNHESPRRTVEYVTRKISKAAARISKGVQKELVLGDCSLEIDFGYAKEFMEAAWNIMQLDKPDDFIICTGELHPVSEFLEEAFKAVNLNAADYTRYDQKFFRPGKNSPLTGDFSKATKAFGYKPKVKFKDLVKIMVENDLRETEDELLLKDRQAIK